MRSTAWIGLAALALGCSTGWAAQTQKQLHYRGSTYLGAAAPSAVSEIGLEIRTGPEVDASFERLAKGTVSPARVPSSHVPTPADTAVSGVVAGAGFDGLTHADQRLASNGNQFSSEPPDQGLAVGNGYIVEAVNTAIRVRKTDGTILVDATGLNGFFGLPVSIDRKTGTYGPFTSDPKVYFDHDTQRWFVTLLEIDQDPATGNFQPQSSVLIAVSKTADPTGLWNQYSIDTTNGNGSLRNHPGCPCFGDQPLIGADANGFYVTTNEFPLFVGGFNGAQVYAMPKALLAQGSPVTVLAFEGLPLAEGPAYSLQPAITAQGGGHALANGGTEYFLSALDFNNSLDNRIALWSLTHTSQLATNPSQVQLTSTIIDSQVYGAPPSTQQKPGPTPLADQIKAGKVLGVKTGTQNLELIDGNDDRMQQVTWADGKLWSALNTVVKPANGTVHSGIAYFVVDPVGSAGQPSMVKQGYVSLSGNSVVYPSVGVNTLGKGVIAFSIVGDTWYPSVGYVPIDQNGTGPITIVAQGAGPDDGFSGYAAFGGRVGRWGDYSAAVADSAGTIWFANEYIPGGPRTALANWGTFIGHVTP